MLTAKLAETVRGRGHHVEIVRLPLNPSNPADIQRVMDFSLGEDMARWIAPPDMVLALRFPAYLVRHPDKRVWLLHQLRQYYEYYGQTCATGNAQEHDALRERLQAEDTKALSTTSRLWAMSRRISERLQSNNGVSSSPLHPPLPVEEGFYRGRQEPYVFAPSRLEMHKRQWLLIEAMRHVRSGVKAVIGGECGAFEDYRRRIEAHGLQDRVLLCGHLPHSVQASWYANSLGVFFGAEDEDYGFITLEAMLSGKPVITCVDSGGPLDFVEDGLNGFIVAPQPEAVAEKIDWMASHGGKALSMGAAGYDRYRKLDLTWDRTATVLLEGRGA